MKHTRTIPSDLDSARQVEQLILDDYVCQDFSEVDCFAIKLALEEALANAIKHGNRYDESKKLHISWERDEKSVTMTIMDEGSGFSPSQIPDPTTDENRERPYGRGLMLIKAYMDKVQFNDAGTSITMTKFLSSHKHTGNGKTRLTGTR